MAAAQHGGLGMQGRRVVLVPGTWEFPAASYICAAQAKRAGPALLRGFYERRPLPPVLGELGRRGHQSSARFSPKTGLPRD